MRFTSINLGPSEWICSPQEVAQLAKDLSDTKDIWGFDTETDGLGFRAKKADGKETMSGDGLGAKLEVLCLAFDGRRIAVPTWGPWKRNISEMVPVIRDKFGSAATYNSIFDANVVEYNYRRLHPDQIGWELPPPYIDGFQLWHLWDEDGEETGGRRDLKSRALKYLGLPMNDFDDILHAGGIVKALTDPSMFDSALDYCTRDAVAHRGLALKGAEIAQNIFWAYACPICESPCPQENPDDNTCRCLEHGWMPRRGKWYSMLDYHFQKDRPFLQVIKRMEQRGVKVDLAPLQSAARPIAKYCVELEKKFSRECDEAFAEVGGVDAQVNWRSSASLARFYYKDVDANGIRIGLGLPSHRRTKTGGVSTGIKDLQKLGVLHGAPGVNTLVTLTKFQKINSSFIEGLAPLVWSETGRLHPTMRIKTVTSRMAMQKPNGQNMPSGALVVEIPPTEPMAYLPDEELAAMWEVSLDEVKEVRETSVGWKSEKHEIEIRSAFVADEGTMLVCADYAQLEVRLMAIESKDPELCRVINDNLDMHCFTADKAYSTRFPGMSYQSLLETQETKDGFYAARLRRAIEFSRSHDLEALPDFLAEREHPIAGTTPDLIRDTLDQVKRYSDQVSENLVANGWDLEELIGLDPYEGKSIWEQAQGSIDADCLTKLVKLLGIRDSRNKVCRAGAKIIIFGTMYGMGPTSLAMQITEATGVQCTVEEARDLQNSIINETFCEVGRTVARQHEVLRRQGYVRTALGRIRTPAGAWSNDGGRIARALRQAGNFAIQGLASDVMREVMLAVEDDAFMREAGAVIILQVHDELLLRCREDYAEEVRGRLIHLMETRHGLDSPIPLAATGHAAFRWSQAK